MGCRKLNEIQKKVKLGKSCVFKHFSKINYFQWFLKYSEKLKIATLLNFFISWTFSKIPGYKLVQSYSCMYEIQKWCQNAHSSHLCVSDFFSYGFLYYLMLLLNQIFLFSIIWCIRESLNYGFRICTKWGIKLGN